MAGIKGGRERGSEGDREGGRCMYVTVCVCVCVSEGMYTYR